MDSQQLFEQVLQQYGLVGFLLALLITGPGFTYFKTRSAQIRIETRAQKLLNEFVRQERQRADRLENRLDATLEKLEAAETEMEQLKKQLAEARQEVEQLPALLYRIEQLTHRVNDLEAQIQQERGTNQQLQVVLYQREKRISALEEQVKGQILVNQCSSKE